jgi:hypothetical protein
MTITTPRAPSAPTGGNRPSRGRHPTRWVLGVLMGVAAAGLVAGLLIATGSTRRSPTRPTASPGTTVPSTIPPPASNELATALYPTPASGTRFIDPAAAARGFAVDFVGFRDPFVGGFNATGAESGTVEVRADAGGAITTVRLHRMTGSWWVMGSSTPDIRLSAPATSATIASPVRVQGMSTAFEAQVNVQVRQDGARAPIGSGQVMGGSMGTMGAFDGSLAFSSPNAARGALVLFTLSMKDGNIYEATVARVTFSSSHPLVPTDSCPKYSMARPTAPAGEMVVTVFYSCDVDAVPVPTYRLYPTTTALLRTALDELVAGPSSAERAAGLQSWFSSLTAGMVRRVTLSSGSATVDFGDMRSVIPNASTSAGSRLLLSQLDATVFQFPTVTSVFYRIDGSCQTFGEWLQLDTCAARARSTP